MCLIVPTASKSEFESTRQVSYSEWALQRVAVNRLERLLLLLLRQWSGCDREYAILDARTLTVVRVVLQVDTGGSHQSRPNRTIVTRITKLNGRGQRGRGNQHTNGPRDTHRMNGTLCLCLCLRVC